MSDNDADTERCTESNDQYDDPERCVVETPDGRGEAISIIDTNDGMVRVTAVAVADDTWSVVTHSPDAARVLAEELEAAADRAEEESAESETPNCVHDCDREAEVRVDFGPDVRKPPQPMCRNHAGFECQHHPEAETIPLEEAGHE
jgi:hypothetical protein